MQKQIKYALTRMQLIPTVRALDFFICELAMVQHTLSRNTRTGGLRFHELSESALRDNDCLLHPGLQTKDWAIHQFALGSRAFAASSNETIVGWYWFNPQHADFGWIHRSNVLLPCGFSYVHGLATAPSCRRQGVATTLKEMMFSKLADDGFSHTIAACFPDNSGAQRWHRCSQSMFEQKFWGRVTYVQWLRQRWWKKRLAGPGRKHPSILDNY